MTNIIFTELDSGEKTNDHIAKITKTELAKAFRITSIIVGCAPLLTTNSTLNIIPIVSNIMTSKMTTSLFFFTL